METIQQAGISAPPRRAVYMEIRKEPILELYRIFSIKKTYRWNVPAHTFLVRKTGTIGSSLAWRIRVGHSTPAM
jgi:hypothetical protein